MNTATPNELQAFHGFVAEKLKNGGANLTPEEAVDEWRELHPEPDDFEEDPGDGEDDVAAIQAALDDLARGEKGMSLEEFDRELRKEFPYLSDPNP